MTAADRHAARVHRWHRRLWWSEVTASHKSLRRVVRALRKPWRAAQEARAAIRRQDLALAGERGVTPAVQFMHQCWLRVRHDLPCDTYYRYDLHLPEQRARARRYVSHAEGILLLTRLDALVSPKDQAALADKRTFLARCEERGLPAVPILASYEGGQGTGPQAGPLPELPPCDLFVKPAALFCGIGATCFRHLSGHGYEGPDGRRFTSVELHTELARRSLDGPLVLQKCFVNDPRLLGLTGGGLATIRFVTLRRPEGGYEPLLAVLKLPIGASVVDNFAQGNLAAPIDGATGRLGVAVRKQGDAEIVRCAVHPDTGERIEGFMLPDWDAVIALAVRAHAAFAEMVSVGWDIALTDSGCLLVEGNDCWDVDLMQIPHRRPLGETRFAEIYDFFMKRAWATRPARGHA